MRAKSNATHLKILSAAKTAFEQDGFERTSMDHIAERSRVAKATLYNYFKSKEALFLAVIEQVAGKHVHLSPLPEQACTTADPIGHMFKTLESSSNNITEALQEFGERVIASFHTPSMLASKRMVIGASNQSSIGQLFFDRGPGKGFKAVEAFFAKAIAAQQLRAENPKIMAAHFRGLLTSEFFDEVIYNTMPAPSSPDEIKAITARAVAVFMKAYGPQDAIK
jgi:AcrR family transcriptional regulator